MPDVVLRHAQVIPFCMPSFKTTGMKWPSSPSRTKNDLRSCDAQYARSMLEDPAFNCPLIVVVWLRDAIPFVEPEGLLEQFVDIRKASDRCLDAHDDAECATPCPYLRNTADITKRTLCCTPMTHMSSTRPGTASLIKVHQILGHAGLIARAILFPFYTLHERQQTDMSLQEQTI